MSSTSAKAVIGERRVVTAVFADVVGSTTLMESIDPEDWTAIVNDAFNLMSHAVHRYGGTIAQLQGDALVAFFGAPVAHEDDPDRAVRSALDMVSAIQPLRQRLRDEQGIDFQIRAGLNTGMVVVGRVGTDLHREYTALGDAMNVAARMEAAARPGTVLLTEDTYRLVAPSFDFHDLGAIAVKGKAEPVHAFEVVGAKATPASTRGIAGLKSRMVGRDAELEALERAFDVLRGGRGTIACVVGEPGLGKTRLVSEFKTNVLGSAPDVGWVEGHCISYGSSLAYHLVLDLVRSCIGVSAASADEEAGGEALRAALSVLPEEERSVAYPLLAHLLSLPTSPADAALLDKLDPEVLQLRYASGLKQLLNALTEARPLVMILEDVHWADQASVELLRRLLALGAPLRTLVCLTARPDAGTAGWRLFTLAKEMAGDALTEIKLSPLTGDDSGLLMASLLEIESLPPQLRDKLLARAEGNPLFIEELIKVLIERGVIVRRGERWIATEAADVEVPDTLRGLLLARIDRLPAPVQRTLKVASVIGRQFRAQVLRRVLEDEPPDLNSLEDSGLVRIAGVDPELEYAFRHSLVQDTAYHSLLKSQRRELHLKVGEAMEQLYSDRRDEVAAELALHFDTAGDDRAVAYLMRAGADAQRRNAVHEARSAYKRAVDLLENREDPSSLQVRVQAVVGAAEAGWTFTEPGSEIAALEDVVRDAEELADDRLLVRVYSMLAMLRQYQGEKYGVGAAVTEAVDRANEISERIGDRGLRAGSLAALGWALAQGGEFERGIALLEEAVPLLEQSGRLVDLGLALDGLAFAYTRLGQFKLGDEWLARAEKLSDLDPIAKLDYLSVKGAIAMFRNKLDEALETAQICTAGAEELGLLSCSIGSHLTIGMVHMMRGRADLALPYLERGGELSLVSLKFWQPLIGAARATAEAMLGRMDKAAPRWQAALDRAREIGDTFVEASVLQMRAGVAAHGTDPDWGWILPDLRESVRIFEKHRALPFLARALRDLGTALISAGRRDEAIDVLGRAKSLFESMELSTEAGAVRQALSELG